MSHEALKYLAEVGFADGRPRGRGYPKRLMPSLWRDKNRLKIRKRVATHRFVRQDVCREATSARYFSASCEDLRDIEQHTYSGTIRS